MHYEVSTSELSTLYTLAAQCPYIYGTAVYQARNLLVLADSNYAPTLTPCELGYQNGTAKTDAPPGDAANRQSSMQLVNQLHVFPNPASQQIMVMFESDKHRAGTIQITSVTGHLVFEEQLNANQNTLITLPVLANGLYLCRVIVNEEQVLSEKLVISK